MTNIETYQTLQALYFLCRQKTKSSIRTFFSWKTKMAVLKSLKLIMGFLLTFCVVGMMYLAYFHCAGWSCTPRRGTIIPMVKPNYEGYLTGRYLRNKFPQDVLKKRYTIDVDNGDVIVFLHIQKTSGTTFEKNLVTNLASLPHCKCKRGIRQGGCRCLNKKGQQWLFSRYSTGWSCGGLHGDWTGLNSCVDHWYREKYGENKERKYYYLTMLRDPVSRFISEWLNVQRGANWQNALLMCNGRKATREEVPFCFKRRKWTEDAVKNEDQMLSTDGGKTKADYLKPKLQDVSLKKFMACRHNLAYNRQTRMLANLTTVHCYNTTAMSTATRHTLLLQSAKHNLQHMAFFGLAEFHALTQVLFQHTLHIRFCRDFVQNNHTHSGSNEGNVSAEVIRRIRELNQLDVELYQFAKDLFLQRVRQVYTEQGRLLRQQLTRLLAQEAVVNIDPLWRRRE